MTTDRPRIVVLIVDFPPTEGDSLADDLRTLLDPMATVEIAADGVAAAERARVLRSEGALVPVTFVDVDVGESPSALVVQLHEEPALEATRNVLVTSKTSLGGADDALRRGAVHGMLTRPWSRAGLRAQLVANLAVFLTQLAPERLDEFDRLLDAEARAQARVRLEQQQEAPQRSTTATPFLLDSSIDEDEIEQRMIELIDRSLGHPPRLRVAPGTIMIESGDDVGGIYVILDGTVQLASETAGGERILHRQSTGAIVGLLSLASHRTAMLQVRAVTDVRALPVTLDQLATALAAEPELAALLTRVLVASLARRLRHSDELQVELGQSLAALTEARAQLVATARFAALGEMAAGMAHELNNPTAALGRSAEHLLDDIGTLVTEPALLACLRRQLDDAPLSTSELRAQRRALADALGDRHLADRLIDIGTTDPADAVAALELDEAALLRLEAAARLGRSLRALMSAGERVQTLVGSLRAYSRGDDGRGPLVPGVDVAAGLDDALRLLAHRMARVDLDRHYRGPATVTARPGELQQVWTNLLTNALDAIGDEGHLIVRVESIDPSNGETAQVRVEVTDDGPGVAPELREQIFEPRFTTKHGRVEYGLGLGLSISRQIVDDHGGSIALQSEPGRTTFRVELPLRPGLPAEAPPDRRQPDPATRTEPHE